MLISVPPILFMESNHTILFPPARHSPVPVARILEEKFMDLIHFLMFTSLFVGIAGGGMVYVAAFAEGVACGPVPIVIMFLVGFSVYNLNRKTDEAEDAINRADRYSFTKKFEKHLFIAALVTYGLAIAIAAFYGVAATIVILIPLVAGILYSIPCLPPSTGYRRLKEIPVVKNLVVGFAWGTTLTFIPLLVTGTPATMATAVTLVFFSTYAFIASTLPDIRDLEGDAQAGVRTIPVVIGEKRTLILITLMNLFIGVGATIISVVFLSLVIALIFAISTLYLHLCIRNFTRAKRKDIACDILTDGQFLIIGLMIFCGLLLQPLIVSGYL
jgi:4-hydroxybenzoate polyprenyltransferase